MPRTRESRLAHRWAPRMSFDRNEQILFVELGFRFETREQLEFAFETIDLYWAAKCEGRKVYGVIDYTGFWLDPSLTEAHAECVRKTLAKCSLGAVRFSQDTVVRFQLAALGIKIHQPKNVYASRAEAVDVIRGLRAHTIVMG